MTLIDNSKQTLSDLQKQIEKALTKCALVAEGYAKLQCPVDTGALRNSITHKVSDNEMAVGTNMEYGSYIEFGTGIYSEKGGRQTPWVYQDANGNWWTTSGRKPVPYIKPSIADHADQYKK